MKAVSVQRRKVSNKQIEKKLDEIAALLKIAIKEGEKGTGEFCSYCGKPVKEHVIKPSHVRKLRKWIDGYRSGRIRGKVYKDFAEFTRSLS